MLIGIILLILTFVMGILEFYDDISGFFSFLGTLFVHLIVTGVMFLVGILIAVIIGLFMPKHWEETKINLASLKDADGIEGNFVLGSGYIQTAQYYMWYENTGHGYRPEKVKVGTNILIVEDSTLTNTGYLIISTRKMNNKSLTKWLIIDESTWSDQYKFIIPEGSIKKNFKL